MIWIILFFIIILIFSVLAYRSMRDYEEFPDSRSLNALFYIGNPQNLTSGILGRMHDVFLSNKQFFSLEKLINGKERARVIFGPRDMAKDFPELNLVEIEDYLSDENSFSSGDTAKKVNVNQVLSWLIEPKNNPKKPLVVGDEFRSLSVEENQKIFIQAVLMPTEKSGVTIFQSTLRIMIAEPDSIKRIELAKKINQTIATLTGLNKHEDSFPESKKYESFKQRSLIPKEVAEFPFTGDEILSLIS